MPLQISRPLILLAVIVVLFLVIRFFLVPESFGEKGFYRSVALEENADKPVKHVGEESCVICHDDVATARDSSHHANLNCETCHGPGFLHIESAEAKDIHIPTGTEFCAWCHSENAGRSELLVKQQNIAEHLAENEAESCIDCHNPHSPWN
jgi:hypothetical protein